MKINIYRNELEPGTHFSRKTISSQLVEVVELPEGDCKEVRADWGQYLPVVTFPAIERALRLRGKLGFIGSQNHCWSFSVA